MNGGGGKKLAVLSGNSHVCVFECAHCVMCPRLPLACVVAQSPHSPLTHSYTIAALWPHKHRARPLCTPSLSHYSPPPRLRRPPPCSSVDISAVTVNLARTPDLDARLTGEPHFSPGCAACAVLTSAAGPAAPVVVIHMQASIVWSGIESLVCLGK